MKAARKPGDENEGLMRWSIRAAHAQSIRSRLARAGTARLPWPRAADETLRGLPGLIKHAAATTGGGPARGVTASFREPWARADVGHICSQPRRALLCDLEPFPSPPCASVSPGHREPLTVFSRPRASPCWDVSRWVTSGSFYAYWLPLALSRVPVGGSSWASWSPAKSWRSDTRLV